MEAIEHYLPFIESDVVYINARLREELASDVPECPRFTHYCQGFINLITLRDAIRESAAP